MLRIEGGSWGRGILTVSKVTECSAAENALAARIFCNIKADPRLQKFWAEIVVG